MFLFQVKGILLRCWRQIYSFILAEINLISDKSVTGFWRKKGNKKDIVDKKDYICKLKIAW